MEESGEGSAPESEVISARCALDPTHPLRVLCTVELRDPGPASVDFGADGAPGRSFSSDVPGTDHSLLGWGLKPSTAYTWTIGSVSGEVQTGPLPTNLQEGLTVEVSGEASGFDAVLLPVNCGFRGFALIDPEGDVIGYTETELYQNGMDAYQWSRADRSLLVGNDDVVREFSLSGDLVLELDSYSGRAHHDLARWGPYTYVLHDSSFNDLQVDGVHVFEGTTLVDTFRLEDHFEVDSPGGFGNDWAHVNGITPTADGHLILSSRNFDSVLSVDMDPASQGFLQIDWIAAGNGEQLAGTTHVAPEGEGLGFSGQHNASLVDGALTLFDNAGGGLVSRAARYHLDDASGSVVLDESWDVGFSCPIQGGAVPVPGGVLATCMATRDVLLFQDGQPDPVFTLNASCAVPSMFGAAINRGIPVWVE